MWDRIDPRRFSQRLGTVGHILTIHSSWGSGPIIVPKVGLLFVTQVGRQSPSTKWYQMWRSIVRILGNCITVLCLVVTAFDSWPGVRLTPVVASSVPPGKWKDYMCHQTDYDSLRRIRRFETECCSYHGFDNSRSSVLFIRTTWAFGNATSMLKPFKFQWLLSVTPPPPKKSFKIEKVLRSAHTVPVCVLYNS